MPTDLPKAWKDGMDSLFSESFVSGFPQEDQARVNGMLRSAADPDLARRRIANTAFLAERFDEPIEKMADILAKTRQRRSVKSTEKPKHG